MKTELTLLLLAYDTAYCYALRSWLARCDSEVRFHYVRTDEEAVQYLAGVGVYSDRTIFPLPDVILLDTNHPHGDDLSVLSWIRDQPQFSRLPLLLLVDSIYQTGVQQAFDLGANSTLVARGGLTGLAEVLEGIREFKHLRFGCLEGDDQQDFLGS